MSASKQNFGRAVIGVVALYAVLLQAFLAVAAPVMTPDLAGVLCASQGDGSTNPDKTARHEHPCCAATHASPLAPPPAAQTGSSPGSRLKVAAAWRPEAGTLHTGPPTRSHSARGPPSA